MKRYFLILLIVFCVVICEDISAQEDLKTWYITLNLQKVELKDKKLEQFIRNQIDNHIYTTEYSYLQINHFPHPTLYTNQISDIYMYSIGLFRETIKSPDIKYYLIINNHYFFIYDFYPEEYELTSHKRTFYFIMPSIGPGGGDYMRIKYSQLENDYYIDNHQIAE